jgi:hypothetical protein
MNLTNLLKNAESGLHPACEECPWNPKRADKPPAFGVSCIKHGVDWSVPASAVSVLIARDPAGTTPEKTGILCGVCNSQFATDRSAQHGYSLWKAAVSLAESGQNANRYMKNHYSTNAIMHGVLKDKNLERARVCCKNILLEQIKLLSPKIIIACGKDASNSLFELNIISKHWDVFKSVFSRQVYSEQTTLPSGKKVTVYCTYHSSATCVNTHVARLYSGETDGLLTGRIEQLPDALPAQRFLQQYKGLNGQELNGEDKGMRVLLLHWLKIGEGIRRANAELNS